MDPIVTGLHLLTLLVFPVVLIWAAVGDLAAYRIPNRLSLILAGGFVLAVVVAGLGWEEILWRIGAGLALFAVGTLLFSFGGLGGGDVKIIAAAAPWIGWAHMPRFLLVMTLVGGGLSLALLIARNIKALSQFRSTPVVGNLLSADEGVPYGVAIAAGGLSVFAKAFNASALFTVS